MSDSMWFFVSHTHWDREWYRTFEQFRARMVDLIDTLLEYLEQDEGYVFVLDGQTVIVEDYLAIRPSREKELAAAVASGRLAVGPWYVQPDSLLPSGEAQVRNLLQGRKLMEALGGSTGVGYTPDSFGHPAQMPQILAGFGLGSFVFWRGGGDELDALPSEFRWVAPDGSSVLAHYLSEGYFGAGALPSDPIAAATRLAEVVERIRSRTRSGSVLLMNGADHLFPEPHTREVARELGRITGAHVVRSTIDGFIQSIDVELPLFEGELCGAREVNLLPGVWSARLPLKLRNRRCEALLEGWGEPFAALGRVHGLQDERPSLELAWRSLLQNQAHDSICGCSLDRVHRQMEPRFDRAEELTEQTISRTLERLAGAAVDRQTPWRGDLSVAVFNPSPHPRTDTVRFPVDAFPAYRLGAAEEIAIHPVHLQCLITEGYEVDGKPARLVTCPEAERFRLTAEQPDRAIEFLARDVPAFGWRRFEITPSDHMEEVVDESRDIHMEDRYVTAAPDGSLKIEMDGQSYDGVGGLDDAGDRGDTYDADPVSDDTNRLVVEDVFVKRRVHPHVDETLTVTRRLRLPAGLDQSRERRSTATVKMEIETEVRLVPGSNRVDLTITFVNTARDHRLRLLIPTGSNVDCFEAATTFDTARRSTARPEGRGWKQPPVGTFVHQGWVAANRIAVLAPGLPEAEVRPDGTVAMTLVRAVGDLSRPDLRTRTGLAGPWYSTPDAQCQERISARLSIVSRGPQTNLWSELRGFELGLKAVLAGDVPLLAEGVPAFRLEPRSLHLSAIKPADRTDGTIARVLNPTDGKKQAILHTMPGLSSASSVRLDETPDDGEVVVEGNSVVFEVPSRSTRSVALCWEHSGR